MDNVRELFDPDIIEMEAYQWLIKFDSDAPPTENEVNAWHEWLNRSPAHKREWQRINVFWNDADVMKALAIPLSKARKRSVFVWLRELLALPLIYQRVGVLTGVFSLGICVVFGVLSIINIDALLNSSRVKNGTYGTVIGQQKTKTLSDGTLLQMNTDSQVRIEYNDKLRKIFLLRGEAHFNVAENVDRPFEVYAGNGMVRAVGTAFAVYFGDNELKVIVNEGKVDLAALEVATAARDKPVIHEVVNVDAEYNKYSSPGYGKLGSLVAGQSAVFNSAAANDTAAEIEELSQAELARILSWRTGFLVFNGDSLSDVVKELGRYTSITIEVVDPALNDIRVGGRFKVNELDAVFDVLEVSFGMRIKRINDQHIQLLPKQSI